ncbi:MAG: YggU family protein, partial [Deltaproteobacteria bacterium]|nr:YggU family protein [Deltaproteobacteria bacterium]
MKRRTNSNSSQSRHPFLEPSKQGIIIRVHVQPGASKDQISGLYAGQLKIKLKALPVEGRANNELIEFLSRILSVKKKSLSIVSGLKARDKKV